MAAGGEVWEESEVRVMDIVILDLEWNAAYSRRLQGYINEIIEFGAVKCGEDAGEIGVFLLCEASGGKAYQ